jgi:group I intron endonuclease
MHRKQLKEKKHHSILLQRAWDKYKEQSFTFEVIEEATSPEHLLTREQVYLDYYKSYEVDKGYNICKVAGSSLGVKHSEETIQKYRQRKHSEETRKKLSEAGKGKVPWNKGKQTSDQAKSIMSERKEKTKKKVEKICPETGIVVEYKSLKDAERDGYHRYHIFECCNGIKKTHKGYFWKYAES